MTIREKETSKSKDLYFYDTSSLLLSNESLFKGDKFAVSSITFTELERIKTSANKSPEIKYAARVLLRLFNEYPDSYDVVIHKIDYEAVIKAKGIEVTDDTKILSDAIYYNDNIAVDAVIFVTNDLALKHIANLFFGNKMIESMEEEQDDYVGYKEINCGDTDFLADFYTDDSINYFDLNIGEYLILRDNNEICDIRVWTGQEHRHLNYQPFVSDWFGKITPYHNDPYQKLLFDSLINNKITMVKGPAGTGKSITSLGFLMYKMQRNDIDKIIIFCNTVATANSAKLGLTY